MKSLAENIRILAGQLDRLKKVPSSDELRQTINEFPGMMGEVMDFIQEWLKNWTRTYEFMWDRFVPDPSVLVKYILVAAQKEKVVEQKDKLNNFKDKFMVELTIDMRVEQGLVFAPDPDCPTCLIRGISRHGDWCEVYPRRCRKSTRWAACCSYTALVAHHFYRNCKSRCRTERTRRFGAHPWGR